MQHEMQHEKWWYNISEKAGKSRDSSLFLSEKKVWKWFLHRDQVFPGRRTAYTVYGKNLFSGFLVGFQGVDSVGICGPGEFQGFAGFAFEASGS